MRSPRQRMDILAAFRDLGSYRAAADLCGTTDKTVKRVVLRQQQGPPPPRPERQHNTAVAADIVREKLAATDGRISAKRLLPLARTAGYTGSARDFRRLVRAEKDAWRRRRRVYRRWLPTPSEHLAIDWGQEGPLHIFSAVLVWSRVRFVRFALDETRATTLRRLSTSPLNLKAVRAPRTKKEERCRRSDLWTRSRIGYGGGPSGTCPAGRCPKPPQAASVKSRGGEHCGKGVLRGRQVRARKASVSEPLMTCRNQIGGVGTGVGTVPRDELGGSLSSVQAAPGMKAARAWPRIRCGTWEPVAPRSSAVHGTAVVAGREREDPKPQERRGAEYRGGAQGRTAPW